jgi:hypothetical protein
VYTPEVVFAVSVIVEAFELNETAVVVSVEPAHKDPPGVYKEPPVGVYPEVSSQFVAFDT